MKSRREAPCLWVLDKTKTAMGARLLRSFIEQPLIHKDRDPTAVRMPVEELNMNYISREEIWESI